MKRALILVGVVAALSFAGVQIARAHPSRAAVTTGVVIVETNLAYQNGAAAGTGMVLTSAGEVLTNNHVIRGSSTIHVVIPSTKRSYVAHVVGYDLAADVAILRLDGASGLATVSTGTSATLKSGESVSAVGNAGGTGALTTTTGSITGLGRNITVSDDQGSAEQLQGLIETDAGLQPGDSGGPLLDSSHRVIGMDTAASAGFTFQPGGSDGFAIPIDRALAIAKQIEAGRSSAQVHVGATAFLGVRLEPSGYFRGQQFAAGQMVDSVVPGSPVAHAGIVAGDVITKVNGHAIQSSAVLVSLLVQKHPGDKVTLTWVDQLAGTHTGTVTLASGPPQ
ncbi:MAG TPA: trypsin-like peptidase domain-containing protein [Gaiellaceae bacterium]|nr:trypsin-like peptidase domain-containing protein [Gaiellaceae bacterium]